MILKLMGFLKGEHRRSHLPLASFFLINPDGPSAERGQMGMNPSSESFSRVCICRVKLYSQH